MHRCYDKALYTIQKVNNYDPSNLEYILLKAIILRISGRFKEALVCLGKTKNILEKKIDSPVEITDSLVVPLLSMTDIKKQIRRQFLLIR